MLSAVEPELGRECDGECHNHSQSEIEQHAIVTILTKKERELEQAGAIVQVSRTRRIVCERLTVVEVLVLMLF